MIVARSKLPEGKQGAKLLQEAVNIGSRLRVPGSYVQDEIQRGFITSPDHFDVNPKQALGVKSHSIILLDSRTEELVIIFTVNHCKTFLWTFRPSGI